MLPLLIIGLVLNVLILLLLGIAFVMYRGVLRDIITRVTKLESSCEVFKLTLATLHAKQSRASLDANTNSQELKTLKAEVKEINKTIY